MSTIRSKNPATDASEQALISDTLPIAENPVQTETLDVLSGATNYNRRIMQFIAPHVGSSVLEIGCGTGNFTRLLLAHEPTSEVTALDVVSEYVPKVYENVGILDGKKLDVRCQNVFESSNGLGRFDTIVMLNVLEHIQNDDHAVQALYDLLEPGGKLILLVPAHRFLYSNYDRSIHHYRRYEKPDLATLLKRHRFELNLVRYFNWVGIFGWWMKFCVMKKEGMDPASVKLFDKLSPVFGLIEDRLPLPAGLSLIAVGQK